MKKYITRKNIGWLLTGLISILLLFSAFGKLSGNAETQKMMSSHNLDEWTLTIGIGELASLLFFIFPRTFRLGTLLLSAYFGGAIVFHMAHPDITLRDFGVPVGLLVFLWIIAWVRGFEIWANSKSHRFNK